MRGVSARQRAEGPITTAVTTCTLVPELGLVGSSLSDLESRTVGNFAMIRNPSRDRSSRFETTPAMTFRLAMRIACRHGEGRRSSGSHSSGGLRVLCLRVPRELRRRRACCYDYQRPPVYRFQYRAPQTPWLLSGA
jgi:hypothetical protein